MKKQLLPITAILMSAVFFTANPVMAQMSTPPATTEELEVVYTAAIEGRTADIVHALNLTDATKAGLVHDIIVAQYRALRARDAVIDAKLKAEGKEVTYTNRAGQLEASSKTLHDQFIAKLATVLTPEQIVVVKDKLTYNKVTVTFDAYVAIVPGLKPADKTQIMDLLKAARDEAIDGGSAPEKTAIFQKYKDQINTYLDANGYDTAKAFKEWEAKQESTKTAATTPAPK